MSRDDYISKLFIDNEHKLEESPSGDLWDRLSTKLDQELPVDQSLSSAKTDTHKIQPTPTVRIRKFFPYMAAASILILIVAAIGIMPVSKTVTTKHTEVAKNTVSQVEDRLLAEENQPIITSEAELKEQFIEEEEEQKEKIIQTIQAVSQNNNTQAVESLEDVELIELESNDVILLEPESNSAELAEQEALIAIQTINDTTSLTKKHSKVLPVPSSISNTTYTKPQDYKYSNSVYGESYNNRGYGVPPSADPNVYKSVEKEAIIKNKELEQDKKTKTKKHRKKRRLTSRKNSQLKQRKQYDIHPKIRIFDWLLGTFKDQTLDQGVSTENWKLLNAHTIEGTGFLMRGKDKIFEEKMLIIFDPTQNRVLLKVSMDNHKKQITYWLTYFDMERIVFEQAERPNYPNKVIFQRLMNGFSTIIEQNNGFLDEHQQRYLSHRNNVANLKAIRNLKMVD